MRFVLFLLFSIVSVGVFGQDLTEARYVDVQWKIGDEKHVSRIDSTITHIGKTVLAAA